MVDSGFSLDIDKVLCNVVDEDIIRLHYLTLNGVRHDLGLHLEEAIKTIFAV